MEPARQAGIEYLKQALGKKQPPMNNALKENLGKACKCSDSMGSGLHKETCNFHPLHLKGILSGLHEDSNSMQQQLCNRATMMVVQIKTWCFRATKSINTCSSSPSGI